MVEENTNSIIANNAGWTISDTTIVLRERERGRERLNRNLFKVFINKWLGNATTQGQIYI